MIKLITAAFAAAALMAAPASATVIDFANEADTNGERALAINGFITIDGVNLQIGADLNYGEANQSSIYPYLDAGNAGLGACQAPDMNNQCVPSNDDNITEDEAVAVFFNNSTNTGNLALDILGLVFRDVDHNLLGVPGNDGMVTIQTVNGTLTDTFSAFIAMAAGAGAFFANTIGIRFIYVDTQFYISSMDVSDVPLPAALPLLLAGLGGLGFASRRRKQAA